MPINEKKVGEQISSLRKAKRLTQSQLGERLSVSYQAVSKWERGITKPRADKLPTLAKLYGCTIEELLGNEPVAVRAK